MIVDGNTNIRQGSEAFIAWILMEVNGETPIDLTVVSTAVLHFRHRIVVMDPILFSTRDDPQKLTIGEPRNTGKVTLKPAVDDFSVVGEYDMFIMLFEARGQHPVPEQRNYTFTVISSY